MRNKRTIWIPFLIVACVIATAAAAPRPALAQDEAPGNGADGGNTLYLPQVVNTTPVEDWIGPYGGKIVSLAFYTRSDHNTVFAGTWGSGVFKSNDGGDTWRAINKGLGNLYIQSLAVSPNNANLIYAGTYRDGVYKSTDGGETWSKKSNGIQDHAIVYSIVIDPRNPNVVYIATRGASNNGAEPWNGSLYKSTDYGENWDERLDNIGVNDKITGNDEDWVYSLSLDPDNPSVIYAASHYTGPFKSTNMGDNWARPFDPEKDDDDNDLISYIGRSIAAVGNNANRIFYGAWTDTRDNRGGVFISDDGGANWSNRNKDILHSDISSVLVNPGNNAQVYIGAYENGIFKSNNAGVDWTKLSSGFQYSDLINTLVMDPYHTNVLFAGTEGDGLYRSTDGGGAWTRSNEGLAGSEITGITVNPQHPNVVLASFYEGGVYQSTDYGATWTNVSGSLLNKDIHGMLVNPSNPTQVFVLTNSDGLMSINLPSGSGLEGSEDGEALLPGEASQWETLNEGLPTVDLNDPTYGEAYPFDDSHPFAGQTLSEDDKLRLQETADFDAQASAPNDVPLLSMATSPTQSGTILLGTSTKGVYRSTDNGLNWSSVGLNGLKIYALAADYSSTPILYAGTDVQKSLKYSTNNGANWSDANLPSGVIVYGLAMNPVDRVTVYAATSDGLYKSASGSNVWTQVAFDNTVLNCIQTSTRYGGSIWVGSKNGLYYATGTDTSWESFSEVDGQSVQTIFIDNPSNSLRYHVYVGTESHGIHRITLFN